ncbi:MAG: hypothetical protein CVV04_09550 [Firmicutes bacterium HGW-Firmicutes-9]|jgi:hypothetical protein|nr:MAG: hypothetical protein CVV04_09550 [Firmicutes bacterium HGW-Firmicutes-9]
MKRIVVAIMAFLLAFSFVGCGSSSSEELIAQEEKEITKVSNAIEESEPAVVEKSEPEPEVAEISFNEITAVDNDECVIKITGIDPDNLWGYTVKINLENKSADKTYMFSVQNAAINGVEIDPLFATEVAAGKKSNNEVSFSDDTLKEIGINEVTDIELTFNVYDSNDWMADAVALETVHVYPIGEEKATIFERVSQPTDTVLFDNESISVIVIGYTYDSIWGYTVNLYLANKTDMPLMYAVDEVSVNGYMADPFWAKEVQPGKVAFATMSWSDTTFEENGITQVEEIEMIFSVYDSNDWMADKLINETITLKP